METRTVATMLNVADLGTKKCNRACRTSLMFFMGIVEFSDDAR